MGSSLRHAGHVATRDNHSDTQREWKYWTAVSRVDNAFGDRNLVCTCPPVEAYEKAEA